MKYNFIFFVNRIFTFYFPTFWEERDEDKKMDEFISFGVLRLFDWEAKSFEADHAKQSRFARLRWGEINRGNELLHQHIYLLL